MDTTTLHTFLFHCPAALRSVVLLGSWDNFAKPYSLELDARRGRGYWRGCFTFSGIICDGDFEQISPSRDGLLKMGGTYWYYYKVDEDEECHNPSESSTTVCPLLPGQRLNVLDIPSERPSPSHSPSADNFTRNPKDRYLTPVPPVPLKPTSFPHLAPATHEQYAMSTPSLWAPRSATYPPANSFLSPNIVRHARSASASPNLPSTPLFADFKGLKEKLASRKRSASRSRSSSNPRELKIGTPILTSLTNEELDLIPLASYLPAQMAVQKEAFAKSKQNPRAVPQIRKEFCPLGSHPVDVESDSNTASKLTSTSKPNIKRRRSHVPSTVVSNPLAVGPTRTRANSADTRRTQHYLFSNDPWLSTPKAQHGFDGHTEEIASPMSVPSQSTKLFAMPTAEERLADLGNQSPNLLFTPPEKELPPLPFRFISAGSVKVVDIGASFTEEPQEASHSETNARVNDHNNDDQSPIQHPRSHFSTWSHDSVTFSESATSDDEDVGVVSPTFSSLTSNYSDTNSPHRLSLLDAYTDTPKLSDAARFSAITVSTSATSPTSLQSSTNLAPHLSPTPPQLEDLRISTFAPELFNLDIHHSDSMPRRQAACFGLGFQYSLPEEEGASKTTLSPIEERPVTVQRESSMSALGELVGEFGWIGERVI